MGRRTRLGLLAALGLATMLAACGDAASPGDDPDEPASGPLPPSPPPSSAPASADPSWSESTPNASPPSDGGVSQASPTPAPPVSAPGGPQASGDPLGPARDYCVQRINQYRASLGRAPLQRVPAAEGCSDQQAASDAATRKAHGAFGACNEGAQNECPGWPGPLSSSLPACLDAMWAEGPGGGHYENMASPSYRYVACGFHYASDGSWWVVQNFR